MGSRRRDTRCGSRFFLNPERSEGPLLQEFTYKLRDQRTVEIKNVVLEEHGGSRVSSLPAPPRATPARVGGPVRSGFQKKPSQPPQLRQRNRRQVDADQLPLPPCATFFP